MNIAFIDIESTGIREHIDPIIEFASVVVDPDLNVLGEIDVIIKPGIIPTDIQPVVLDMHTKNGLWNLLKSDEAVDILTAQQKIIEFYFDKRNGLKTLLPAGSGYAHFDSRFLEAQMSDVKKMLAFYTLDTGVIRRAFEFAGRKDLLDKNVKKNHRALDDCKLHLEEWRKYRELFKQIPEV